MNKIIKQIPSQIKINIKNEMLIPLLVEVLNDIEKSDNRDFSYGFIREQLVDLLDEKVKKTLIDLFLDIFNVENKRSMAKSINPLFPEHEIEIQYNNKGDIDYSKDITLNIDNEDGTDAILTIDIFKKDYSYNIN